MHHSPNPWVSRIITMQRTISFCFLSFGYLIHGAPQFIETNNQGLEQAPYKLVQKFDVGKYHQHVVVIYLDILRGLRKEAIPAWCGFALGSVGSWVSFATFQGEMTEVRLLLSISWFHYFNSLQTEELQWQPLWWIQYLKRLGWVF